MAKYTQLTTTQGLQVDDIVYTDTHGGLTECVVVEVYHEHNTVFAPYKRVWDKYHNRSQFDVGSPVSYYYKK